MLDHIIAHLSDHGSTWLWILAVGAAQVYATVRQVGQHFDKVDRRLDNHEDVLLGMGARVEERTDGRHLLQYDRAPATNGSRSPVHAPR